MIVPTNYMYFDTAIPTSSKEATIFVVNFVVTWKPGLNDLTLHIDLIHSIFYSLHGLACEIGICLYYNCRPYIHSLA